MSPLLLFADATFLVALFNRDDSNHRRALGAMASLAEEAGEAPPLVISDFVFDEVVTTLLYRSRRHDIAAKAGRTLLESKACRLANVGPHTFQEAWKLFVSRADKQWSFTDCTSFRLMEDLHIDTALSFDADFEEAGFAIRP